MASQVDICNLALTKVGAQRITTIADGTEEADLCSLFYDIVRDDVLRAYPWNFALARSSALDATTTPAFEYSYAYTLPADCLRVIKINDWDENFVVEGATILTEKASGVYVLYIKQESTEANWTSQFIMVFATRLAAEVSAKLTGSVPERTAALWQEYANLLPMATVADGYENDPEYDDICKLALGKIQANRQKTWEADPIAEARACNVFYADVRDTVTAEYPWNFAVARSTDLVAAAAPNFGYSNAWTLPSDCLRVLELSDSTENWEVEGSTLVTDETAAPKIRYIQQVTSGFPSNFKILVATRLAAEVSGRLDPQMKESLWQEYQGLLLAAQITDGFEQDRDYTEICNMALGRLAGEKKITSAKDPEEEARLCNDLYASCRDAALAEYPWNFALTTATLSTAVADALGNYTHYQALPSDCLRLIRVTTSDVKWEVIGSNLYLDTDSDVKIIYIKQETSIDNFSATFKNLLSVRFAAELSTRLDPEKTEALWVEYQNFVLAAQVTDGFEQDRDYTKICNMALGKLDVPKQVTSATDPEKEARLCNTFYADLRDEVLMALPWNFAIGRVSIDVDATAPEHSYDYRYAVPDDSLRVLRVWPEDGSDGAHDRNDDCNFEVEGSYILTNDESTTIDIIYIKQITTITSFTNPFIKALSARLAAELALPLTGKVGVQDRMYALYQMELDKGMELDAMEGFQKWESTDSWISKRA